MRILEILIEKLEARAGWHRRQASDSDLLHAEIYEGLVADLKASFGQAKAEEDEHLDDLAEIAAEAMDPNT